MRRLVGGLLFFLLGSMHWIYADSDSCLEMSRPQTCSSFATDFIAGTVQLIIVMALC